MATLHFSSEILINGVNPYVLVTCLQAGTLKSGWRKPMPVRVQINGQPINPWHINMMPVGDGSFYLYLHGDVRKASDTKVGDMVTTNVAFDEDYSAEPETLPEWFAMALAADGNASLNWNRLPTSRQKEVVRSLNRLKSHAAQEKNLKLIMHVLSGRDGRFMGRSWSGGS